jgi:hypothetical protein
LLTYGIYSFVMVAQHTKLILTNMTTNEAMNRWRYAHFQAPDGTFRNPFDLGKWGNFVQAFFRMPDLAAKQARELREKHAAAGGGGVSITSMA